MSGSTPTTIDGRSAGSAPGRGVLVGVCDQCTHVTVPSPQFCPRCLSESITLATLSDGVVYSSTVVRHGVKNIPLPYGLAYVDLNEDVRVMARYTITDTDAVLAIGTPVHVQQSLNESGIPVFIASPAGLQGAQS